MLFLRPSPPTNTSAATSGTQQENETPQQQNLLIQDTVHEILELTPTVPRLSRIEKLLRETSWTGMRGFGTRAGAKRLRDDDDESGNTNVR